jgi:hypothetical protein
MNKKLLVIAVVILIIVALFIVISGFVFGLGGSSVKSYDSLDSELKSQGGFEISASSRDGGTGDMNGKATSMDRKIISTAQLQLEVGNVQTAFNKMTNITLQQGGFISGSSIHGYEERKNGQMTVRVPQKNFYIAIEQIEALGTVKSREIKGQDVTEEYVDISARLGNLQKQENRLSEILKMANTVKDVLEVERELERVRGEIERLTGRMNYLEQSIEMSTITVNAHEPEPFFEDWGITDALKQAVSGFFNSINGLIVFTGNILPIAVYLIVVIFIGMGVKRKVMPRFFGKQ